MGYISALRSKIGQDKFIHPAARILIENEEGEFLFIERKDNGQLGIPAGALEENETIEECIRREVKEETGLQIDQLELIGISSAPGNETVTYPNGDQIQYFTIEFYSNSWHGEINIYDKSEVHKALFMKRDNVARLPKNERGIIHSLDYYLKTGKVRLR